MAHYILQIIFFQLLFLLAYELLLKKETFFTYNRWYLLLTPIISVILPLLKFQVLGDMVPTETFVMLPEVYIGGSADALASGETAATTASALQINWWALAYSIGVCASLILFLKKYRILKSLFQNKTVSREKDFRIIEVQNSDIACTFFNTIFLGDQLNEEEIQQILSHEMVHVKQKHSADLLFFELLKIVFWFNPLIYIYQSRVSTLHEFIADAGVVKNVEKKTYYQQLLNTAFSTKNISFINQFFNHSLIKKRIVMLQKTKSKTAAKFKYLVLVPLMLVMLTYVACSEDQTDGETNVVTTVEKDDTVELQVQDVNNLTAEEMARRNEILGSMGSEGIAKTLIITDGENTRNIYVNSKSGDLSKTVSEIAVQGRPSPPVAPDQIGDVPFSIIEEVPTMPGCEDLADNQAKKGCTSEKIQEFIAQRFNTDLGQELGLEGVTTIYVQFKINKDGTVEILGARAPHPALKEEAERVVNMLPQFSPGKHRGQNVGVLYSLPIRFRVGE